MKKRRILFASGLIAILVGIAIVCLIIGRGHSVFFDNKSIDGTQHESYAFIDLFYKGEKVTSLGKAERAAITLTGQKITVEVSTKRKDLVKKKLKQHQANICFQQTLLKEEKAKL